MGTTLIGLTPLALRELKPEAARRSKMNTYLTSIHRHLGEEKESMLRQINILHEAKEDALAALEKLQFCIDYMESGCETKAAPEECEHKGRSWFHVGQPCPKCG